MKVCAAIVVGLLSCAITAHSQQTPTTGGGVYRVGGGVSAPKAIFAPDPKYSKEALKAKYEGKCTVTLIVGSDGKPHDVHVVRSLGLGLDEKAIEAVKQWRFEPAQKDGKPVAVAIEIEVTFHLQPQP